MPRTLTYIALLLTAFGAAFISGLASGPALGHQLLVSGGRHRQRVLSKTDASVQNLTPTGYKNSVLTPRCQPERRQNLTLKTLTGSRGWNSCEKLPKHFA